MKSINQTSVIFLTILMELTALGMIIPLHPYMARNYGADGLQVGLLMSIYSFMQIITAPIWGKLSDSYGRKPILLIGLFFTSLSYLWFGLASQLSHLFLSRAMAGFFGANMSMAFACISDQTSSQNRSKQIGIIGAAFGFGFVIGPTLGGIVGSIDSQLSHVAFGASFLCAIGVLMTFFLIKESAPAYKKKTLSKKQNIFTSYQRSSQKLWSLSNWISQNSSISKILLLFFVLSLSLTLIEAPLFLFMKDYFNWPQSLSSLGFAYIGFVLALSQGWVVRYLISFFGERKTNLFGFLLFTTGVLSLCFKELRLVGVAVTLFSLGFGFSYISLTGAMSILNSPTQQGKLFGLHQSFSSLSRIIGPTVGGFLYRDYGMTAPFIASSILASVGILLSIIFKKHILNLGQDKANQIAQSHTLSEYVKMDPFQLTNLLQNQIPFSLFFISDHSLPALLASFSSSTTQSILKKASITSYSQLLQLDLEKTKPIVVLCKDGIESQKITLMLSEKYTNIFYLQGGLSNMENNQS